MEKITQPMDERSLEDSKREKSPREKDYTGRRHTAKGSVEKTVREQRRLIKKLRQEKSLYAFTPQTHTLMPKASSFRSTIDLQQIYGQVLSADGASVFPSVKLIGRARSVVLTPG